MNRLRVLPRLACTLASVGLLLPHGTVRAASPVSSGSVSKPQSGPVINDVELAQDGYLAGQLVDVAGAGIPGENVTLMQDSKSLAVCRTTNEGRFAFRGVRGGVYQLDAVGASRVCRCWAPGTAPPSANSGVALIQRSDVVLGQMCPPTFLNGVECLKYWMTEPLVVGGVIAAAVAIPVAIHNRNRSRNTGS